MVRVIEYVAAGTNCPANGAGSAARLAGRVAAICRQSVSESAAEAGASGAVAILVHHAGGKAREWRLVAAGTARPICANAQARRRWKNCGVGVAAIGGTERVTRPLKSKLSEELFDRNGGVREDAL